MNRLLLLLTAGIWIGLVLGLSFIEAPLKFQAPGITTELGLGIGRLVFGALNEMEMVFSILFIFFSYHLYTDLNRFLLILISAIVGMVLIQTIYLLPLLNERVATILSGSVVPDSKLHLIYVVFEILKLPVLVLIF